MCIESHKRHSEYLYVHTSLMQSPNSQVMENVTVTKPLYIYDSFQMEQWEIISQGGNQKVKGNLT